MPPSIESKMGDAGKKSGDFDEDESLRLQLSEKNDNWDDNYENKSVETNSKSEKSERRPESSSKSKSSSKHGGEGKKYDKLSLESKERDCEKIKEKNRSETDGKEKRGSSVIPDKVPKKNAQRTKGSISIGKPVKSDDNTKKRAAFSADNLQRTSTEGKKKEQNGTTPPKECSTTIQKPKMSDKSLRSGTSRKPPREDVKDGDKKPSTRKKKSWSSLAEEDSEEVIKKEETQFDNLYQDSSKNGEFVCSEEPPSSTCSFFGKIQQGVKAYFMSRNSLKFDYGGDDKTKKNITEGGTNLD